MPACLSFALPSTRFYSSHPKFNTSSLRAGRAAIGAALLLTLLCVFAGQAWAAAAATTVTLGVSSKTVNSRPITVMTAKVTDPASVQQGLVRFYDGKRMIGTAQIVETGTRYTKGTANLSAQLAPGAHVLRAVFAGTSTDAAGSSLGHSITVAGGMSATSISYTGTAGNYTLTGQVIASGFIAPTGQVSFLDQSNGNSVIGSAALGSSSEVAKFAKAASYPIYDPTVYYHPDQVVVADFNGDGILDLAEGNYTDSISIQLGNGDGTFQAAAPFCVTGSVSPTPCQAGSESAGLAVGDFNSDGIPDLVVVDGGQVGVALGNGDGTFQAPVYYPTVGSSWPHVVVADLDMDGAPDLATSVNGGVSVLLNNGDGTFQPHSDIAMHGDGESGEAVAVGDFNKDGIPDLASANGYGIMVVLGNGDGTFGAEIDSPIDLNPNGGSFIAADFKGTGFLCDLAVSSSVVDTYAGNGDGTFKLAQTLYPEQGFSEYVGGLLFTDVNGDGIADLAITFYYSSTDTGKVGIFTGMGGGTFNPTPSTYNVGQEPISVAAGDFDGNGALDLVTANTYSNNLSVLLDSVTQTAAAVLKNVSVPGTGTQNVFARYAGDSDYGASSSLTCCAHRQRRHVGAGDRLCRPPRRWPAGGLHADRGRHRLCVRGRGQVERPRPHHRLQRRDQADAILAADIATAGSFPVTVVSGGATSNAVNFTVTSQGTVPVLTAILPNYAVLGSPALTMMVSGSGFVSGASGAWSTGTGKPWRQATSAPPSYRQPFRSRTWLSWALPRSPWATPARWLQTACLSPWGRPPIPRWLMDSSTSPARPGAHQRQHFLHLEQLEYLCTVTGEIFYYSKYVVNVTPADTGSAAIPTANSVGGQIIVKIYDLTGSSIQKPFYITVYKP